MAAKSKRAKKIRTSSEFDLVRLAASSTPTKLRSAEFAWSLERIASARDAQCMGNFRDAASLAQACKTDGAIFPAIENRLAPQRGLPVAIEERNATASAKRQAFEAEALYGKDGISLQPDTCATLNEQLALHGVFFATNVATPRADGSRVDFEIRAWPIDSVYWDPACRTFMTYTEGGKREAITHGDGRWIVGRKAEIEPWQSGAIKALALIWAARAYAVKDRNKASRTHGNGKFVGEMPPNVAILNKDGSLTDEARDFLGMMNDLMMADVQTGLKPSGAKLDFITSNSQAWQIFKDIVDSNATDAARVMLGSDGLVKAAGGDYVKSGILFGVRNDIVEGDLGAMERAIFSGSIEVWSAVNFGDSTNAPRRRWLLPDADKDARLDALAKRTGDFNASVEGFKRNGFVIDQSFIDELAKDFEIKAPRLPVAPTVAPTSLPAAAAAPSGAPRLAAV
jgi:hypothetical protein